MTEITRKMSYKITKDNRVYNITSTVDFTGTSVEELATMLVGSSSPRVTHQNVVLRPLSHEALTELEKTGDKFHIRTPGKKAARPPLSDDELLALAQSNPRVMAAILETQRVREA